MHCLARSHAVHGLRAAWPRCSSTLPAAGHFSSAGIASSRCIRREAASSFASTSAAASICSLATRGFPVPRSSAAFSTSSFSAAASSSASPCTSRSFVRLGSAVSVVTKEDQRGGRLTHGIVARVLTNASVHPRGIKVQLQDGTVGRVHMQATGTVGAGASRPAARRSAATADDEDEDDLSGWTATPGGGELSSGTVRRSSPASPSSSARLASSSRRVGSGVASSASSSASSSSLSSRSSGSSRSFHSSARCQHGSTAIPGGATVHVTFVTPEGERVPVTGIEGENLLALAHANKVELEGACEASLACSTCHVILPDEYYAKLETPCDEEADMLDLAFGLTDTSRLGCQVKLSPELEGMEIKLPAATRNMAVDGHKAKPH